MMASWSTRGVVVCHRSRQARTSGSNLGATRTAATIVASQLRLLLLTTLLLCATVVAETERASQPLPDDASSVFAEPPAYLHPRDAIPFDLSGVDMSAPGGVEAALLASTREAEDASSRAYAHLSLAVYYKLRGRTAQAEHAKRRGDYWRKIARLAEHS